VGQGPLLPIVPAFNNAVYDAIGVRFDEIPVTPDKVLKALDRGATRVGPKKLIDFDFPEPVRAEVPDDATQ
jgi:4-hydroxybenzoyl-CoA reductase subunit alpha